MKKTQLYIALLLAAAMLSLVGCAQAPSTVYRVDPEQEINLSGEWNDTDSQMVSEEMIVSCINAAWAGQFIDETGKLPVLVVGTIYNKTDEHISSDVFISDLERAFIESQRAKIVQGGAALDEIRELRQNQLSFAEPDTRRFLRELGANFVMQGKINKIADTDANRAVYFYQVDLELIDIETVEKTWIGQKKLKKYVERNNYGF
ncbi:MAG: penicillin-binding protein activator LpoB [bacterium]|nr:penicillin-binding protein activator LpoB [bacterium]